MNAGLRRRAPVSESDSDGADQRADADRRVEVADSAVPMSRRSMATTTMNTWTAPATAVCAVRRSIRTRSDRLRPIARKPASASETIVAASSSAPRSSVALAADEQEEDGRDDEQDAVTGNATPVLAGRAGAARRARARRRREALDAARDGVRRRQLLRARARATASARPARSGTASDDRGRDRERVDDRRRRVGEDATAAAPTSAIRRRFVTSSTRSRG